jgi:hypothetical protein
LQYQRVGEVDLDLATDHALRSDGEHVANDKHPDHQLGVDRWSTRVRIVGREVLVHPTEVEHGFDLAHEVVEWHDLIEVEIVERTGLALTCLAPSSLAPAADRPAQRDHGSPTTATGVFAIHSP